MLSRARNEGARQKLAAMRAIAAAWPNIPPGTPDFHISMNFNQSEGEYGGSSWNIRGVQLRGGVLEITRGSGNTDGMTGSDVYEKVTDDVAGYLEALQSDPKTMGGPYL